MLAINLCQHNYNKIANVSVNWLQAQKGKGIERRKEWRGVGGGTLTWRRASFLTLAEGKEKNRLAEVRY